jgi:hypothetical protein
MKITISTLTILLLIGCGSGSASDTYLNLEKEFPGSRNFDGKVVEVNSMTIASKSNNVTSRYSGSTKLKLGSEYIEIIVNSKEDRKIQIPIKVISGCEKTCFGSKVKKWSADILLGVHGTEISFDKSEPVLQWCYEIGLPIVSKEDKRHWMDRGGDLPSYEEYQQVGKEEYERKINKRCNGY